MQNSTVMFVITVSDLHHCILMVSSMAVSMVWMKIFSREHCLWALTSIKKLSREASVQLISYQIGNGVNYNVYIKVTKNINGACIYKPRFLHLSRFSLNKIFKYKENHTNSKWYEPFFRWNMINSAYLYKECNQQQSDGCADCS